MMVQELNADAALETQAIIASSAGCAEPQTTLDRSGHGGKQSLFSWFDHRCQTNRSA